MFNEKDITIEPKQKAENLFYFCRNIGGSEDNWGLKPHLALALALKWINTLISVGEQEYKNYYGKVLEELKKINSSEY